MTSTRFSFIGISKDRPRRRKRIQDQHTPRSIRDHIQSELRRGIIQVIQNKFTNSSPCISLATSEVDQLVVECECTHILRRLLDFCNSRYLGNFQYRLAMEDMEEWQPH